MSLVSVVYYQVEVSATGRSLVQRSLTECVCFWAGSRSPEVEAMSRNRVEGPQEKRKQFSTYYASIQRVSAYLANAKITLVSRDTPVDNQQFTCAHTSKNKNSFCKMPLRAVRNGKRFGGENFRTETAWNARLTYEYNTVLQHAGRIWTGFIWLLGDRWRVLLISVMNTRVP